MDDPSSEDMAELHPESLWVFGARKKDADTPSTYEGGYGGKGTYIPQVGNELIRRYTKQGELVLELFSGHGTGMIEARKLNRNSIGVDLSLEAIDASRSRLHVTPGKGKFSFIHGDLMSRETRIQIEDALSLSAQSPTLVIMHPPYWDIIKYSNNERDLSNYTSLSQFLIALKSITEFARDVVVAGGFVSIIMGDMYRDGEVLPLGFYAAHTLKQTGLKLKGIYIKDIQGNESAKGINTNLWRYRALKHGFSIFSHEYILVAKKGT